MKLLLVLLFSSLMWASTKNNDFLPIINYPFHPHDEIYCDQGSESPMPNSHAYVNTMFALDLHSPKKSKASVIYSGSAGKVVVNNECVEFNTKCGNGFGNFVKVIRGDNVMIMYAHLETVLVKDGDYIMTGTPIGIEGNTGWTGEDNRHLHMSVHFDGQVTRYDDYLQNKYLTPISIPFKMNICQVENGLCANQYNDIRKISCKRKTGKTSRVFSY